MCIYLSSSRVAGRRASESATKKKSFYPVVTTILLYRLNVRSPWPVRRVCWRAAVRLDTSGGDRAARERETETDDGELSWDCCEQQTACTLAYGRC